ncbi:MAG: PadR family transcriptional regulator [Hyphomicrobiales bacterium]
MKRDLTKSQMRKGVLELIILGALSQKKFYPPELAQYLRDLGLEISEGTLYPLLTRLKNDKHLMYQWKESLIGPPRKYYSITDRGRRLLEELKIQWQSLLFAVNSTVYKKLDEESKEKGSSD